MKLQRCQRFYDLKISEHGLVITSGHLSVGDPFYVWFAGIQIAVAADDNSFSCSAQLCFVISTLSPRHLGIEDDVEILKLANHHLLMC